MSVVPGSLLEASHCQSDVCTAPDQWDVQVTIERLVRSLQTRGYLVWFDVDMMKGSTVDAMSDAIDNADVMLYAVSEQYKESSSA